MTEYASLKSTRVKALHVGCMYPHQNSESGPTFPRNLACCISFGRFICTSNPQGDGPTSRLDDAHSGSSQKATPGHQLPTDPFFGSSITPSTGALWPSARRFAPAATATVFVASDWARKNCCSSSFSPPLPGRWESYYCSKTIRKQIFENKFKKSYQKYGNVFYQDRSYSKTQPPNNEDA